MRVFETFFYNIANRVSFGKTKPYLEKMLQETGLSYKDTAFMLYDLQEKVPKKAVASVPELRKYEFAKGGPNGPVYGLSSIRENWHSGEIFAAQDDDRDISLVFSKIPYTFNFPFGYLILNGINWFDDSSGHIAIKNWERDKDGIPRADPTLLYLSNRILQERSFDDGKKMNRIEVTIEVTDENGIRDTAPVLRKLEPYLGTYLSFERSCTFDEEEYRRLKQAEIKNCEKLQQLSDEYMPKAKALSEIPKDIPMLSHVADSATLNKAFKGTRFKKVKGQPNWLHLYACTDGNGYKYEAFVQKITSVNMFRCWLNISGYNFSVGTGMTDYCVEREGESSELLTAIVQFYDMLAAQCGDALKQDFGVTPEWYNEEHDIAT